MATKTDKAAVNAAKNNATKTNQTNQGNAQIGIDGGSAVKAGANRIVDFIDQASDVASNQVADAITAATIQKAMQKLGQGDGELTTAAIATFADAWNDAFTESLPALCAAPKALPPVGESNGSSSFSPTKDQPAANPRSTTDDSPNPAPGEASTPAPRGRLGTAHPTNNQVLLMETKNTLSDCGWLFGLVGVFVYASSPDDQNTDYLRGFKDAVETMDE